MFFFSLLTTITTVTTVTIVTTGTQVGRQEGFRFDRFCDFLCVCGEVSCFFLNRNKNGVFFKGIMIIFF